MPEVRVVLSVIQSVAALSDAADLISQALSIY
jgi:hypothetical protein